jgi:hypothetical protein
MSLGTFAIDSKGQEILPSPTPQMPDLNISPIPYRYNSLEEAHANLGNSPIATLPPLRVVKIEEPIKEVKAEVTINKPLNTIVLNKTK